MDQFDYLITYFIDDNKWINKFNSYFAHHQEFIITNKHFEYFINKKMKYNFINLL